MNSYFITSCHAFKGFILIVCPVNHMVLPFRNFWSDPYASKDGKFASITEKRKKKYSILYQPNIIIIITSYENILKGTRREGT